MERIGLKYIKIYEDYIELKPSDFAKVDPMNCRFHKSEHETIAQNIMKILWRTGNRFRPEFNWYDYKKERLKDGNFTESEKEYFDDVIRWCVYPGNAKQFSPAWAKVKPEAEIDADKYNL